MEATLNLLAEGHRIETFKVSGNIQGAVKVSGNFQGAPNLFPPYNYAFAHLFLPPESSFRGLFMAKDCGWQNALKGIVGVRRLIWANVETDFPDTYHWQGAFAVSSECKDGYEEVRQVMETGQNESNWSIAIDEDYSDTYIDQTSRFN